MLSKVDSDVISIIAQDIPLVQQPFKELSRKVGINENAIISRIKSYKKNGIMRKFCATLNHRKAGFKHNAMVVWNIPRKSVSRAGNLMASFPEVSHCYERKKAAHWNYNLYSMIHARTNNKCLEVIGDISKKTSCADFKVLFSCREYKKSTAKY